MSMNVTEHLDRNSFCYDPQFPPDIAEGLPLSTARRCRREAPAMKRALRECMRAVTRKR